ncbi:MAG: aldo/keto reductase [Candidatus Buchananbacteria bacterium]|nr:aldo/keto reductase [Candidatus Buchananbacteria bacterium]
MNIPVKTLASGFSMPVFGIGTYGMGGLSTIDPANDDNADIAAIKAAIQRGVTHIDTAELYAQGKAEQLLGEAIKGYDRQRLFIVSKVYQDNLAYDNVLKSCEESLKRLGTDYLDLYLIHKFNPAIPLSDTLKAFDELVRRGLIKHIGVSNFCADHLKEAQRYTENKIVFNQVHYNLVFREPQRKGLLDYCQQNDVILGAWRPIERGMLTTDLPPIMKEMMQKYQKSAAQIAINWLVSQPNVVTLSKSTNISHLEDNLGALTWEMSETDIRKLTNEFPGQQDVSNRQPLSDEILKEYNNQQ